MRDRVGQVILDRDETIRPETSPESLASLEPSFAVMGEVGGFDAVALQRYHWLERIDHVHTAGNSSGIVDGACLVLVGNEAAGQAAGLTPRGRVVATAVTGAEPTIMLTGPAVAARKALARVGLTPADIDLYEVNEAFSAVPLRFMRDLDISPDIVNVNGGAIAMGHPLGATGAMLLGTLLDELERRGRPVRPGHPVCRWRHGHRDDCREVVSMIRWEQREDGIVILTLDDPAQSTNTMNSRYVAAMQSTVERLEAERESITGVVVTSAKDTFLAGADLKELSAATTTPYGPTAPQ